MSTQNPTAAPSNPPVITPWYLDKALYAKVLAPVIAMLVAGINHKFNLGLDPTAVDIAVAGVFTSAVAYIIAHKWGATKKAEAVIQNNAKTVALVLALVLTVFSARPAEAAIDYAAGVTFPLVRYDLKTHAQTQLAAGAGFQFSLTEDHLKKDLTFFGQTKTWDLIDLDVLVFLQGNNAQTAVQGAGAVALGAMSSLVMGGIGHPFGDGDWSLYAGVSLNFGPLFTNVQMGTAEQTKAPAPRANRIW